MATYSIEALARAAGTTVRNIRAYREKGLLPKPERQGRRAVYDEGHLVRLKLVTGLLHRGLTTAVIRDVLQGWESGQDVADLLGLEEALVGPPGDETPERVTLADLGELFGRDPDVNQVERAVAVGVLRPDGDEYVVIAPRLLRVGAELTAEGMPLDAVLDLATELHDRIRALADVFVDIVWDHLLAERLDGLKLDDPALGELVALVGRIRPLAKVAVDAELARAIQAGIDRRVPDVMRSLDLGSGAHETT